MLRTTLGSSGRALLVAAMAVALVGCGGDGKESAKSKPTPKAERTDGPGSYLPPNRLCDVIDFSELATAVGPVRGKAASRGTGADPAKSSGSECKQSLGNGRDRYARAVVHCTAWARVGEAIRTHEYAKESAVTDRNGTAAVPGVGRQAFRFVSAEKGVWKDDLRMIVRDSNLDCEIHVQSGHPRDERTMDARDKDIAFAAMGDTLKDLLPKLPRRAS
ncbi:hypothetical protein ACIQCR_34045 [Streptomyces sp. NPDC093249]|uniref:hypothetical protein n=1 Tax=unclassified Streptomyces TaxID=2593676 RepID=UPI003828934D